MRFSFTKMSKTVVGSELFKVGKYLVCSERVWGHLWCLLVPVYMSEQVDRNRNRMDMFRFLASKFSSTDPRGDMMKDVTSIKKTPVKCNFP